MKIINKIKLPVLTCLRCGHQWIPRKIAYAIGTNFPMSCPKCRSWYWDAPFGYEHIEEAKTAMNKAHGGRE